MLGSLNFVSDLVYSKPVFVTTLAENFASFIELRRFPLGEIFRPNRNFYCSNSKDICLVPSECL